MAWGAALITTRLMKRLHWVIRESSPEPFSGSLFYLEPGMSTPHVNDNILSVFSDTYIKNALLLILFGYVGVILKMAVIGKAGLIIQINGLNGWIERKIVTF